MRQVDQRINELREKVVGVNNKWIQAVEDVNWPEKP